MTVIALIPVKGRGDGKQRLAGCLSPPHRSLLIQRMLEDVVQAAHASRGFEEIWIVSKDERLVPRGCRWICDATPDLNTAVSGAAKEALGIADSVVILAADLPFATASDLALLIEAARSSPVVIVPDVHGTGTNGLALSPPTALAPQFGYSSRRRHEDAARANGLNSRTLILPTLATDVDCPTDLERLRTMRPDRYGFLNDFRASA